MGSILYMFNSAIVRVIQSKLSASCSQTVGCSLVINTSILRNSYFQMHTHMSMILFCRMFL